MDTQTTIGVGRKEERMTGKMAGGRFLVREQESPGSKREWRVVWGYFPFPNLL